MNLEKLKQELIDDEGLRLKPYKDTKGLTTIAVGRNLDGHGLTVEECMYLLKNDIDRNWWDLHSIFDDIVKYPEDVQHVLLNMRHQLGYGGFRGFKNMIKAVKSENWKLAASEIRNSAMWRDQYTHARAERNAKRMEKA